MKKVLVTGANGFVGRRLCTSLQKKGYSVIGGVRGSDPFRLYRGSGTDLAKVDFMSIGNIDGNTDWSKALKGINVVVHLAARVHILQEVSKNPLQSFRSVNVFGSERLAASAAQAGVKRFVYVSSISIHGNSTGERPYVETDEAHPHSPYAVSKWEGELALKRIAEKSGLELVIVRPPLVYGPGVGGNFLRLMRWADKGWPLPLGGVLNLRSFIYIDNLVDMLVSCVGHTTASGETFLVADGEDLSTPDLIRRIACLLNRPVRILPFPVGVLRTIAKIVRMDDVIDRLCNSLQVSAEKAHRLLGWYPRTSLSDGLASTIIWYIEKKDKGHMKRVVDIIFASFFLLCLNVPMLFVSLLIKIDSKGPIFHRSKRVGINNSIFEMPKFRTMYEDTPDVATHLLANPESHITKIGQFLRKYSLDELPQLWCVLKGDMSFVGPRPALFNQDDLIKLRTSKDVHKIVPGITGWAQINGRDNLSIEEKVKYDEYYVLHRSFMLDFKILTGTLLAVLKCDGISH